MCACMCVLCVRDINIQRCRHVLEHTHIHILMHRLMYVKVWNIMVLNPNVPDLNKHKQTPDVLRERPCRGSDFKSSLPRANHKFCGRFSREGVPPQWS